MKEYVISQPTLLEESLETQRLEICPSGGLSAPAGKNLTLTVDGVHKNLLPGVYTGDVKVTVTEGFGRAGGFGPQVVGTEFTAALRGENGKIVPERSVLDLARGGSIEEGKISGVSVVSQGNELSGIDLDSGEYTLENVSISMDGYGGSDFTGQGVALSIGGTAKVTASGLNIKTRGVIRGGVMVTDDAEAVIRDSEIVTMGGTLQEYEETTKVKTGMLNVPWQLGLKGNCRASNVLVRGTALYENCKVSSWGWGVLSVDGTDPVDRWEDYSVHMTAKDCEINLLGPSGYTAFAIGPCLDRFENTTFRAADYSLILANETASAEYDNCKIYSRKFGTMSYGNQGGHLDIKNSSYDTQKAVFLIKGCYPQISVSNSSLVSQEGVILQLIDCDDPSYSANGKYLDSVPPEKIPEHDVTRVNYRDFYLFNKLHAQNKPTDVQAHFFDMSLTGDFYNGIANRCPVGSYDPTGKSMFGEAPDPEPQAGSGPASMPEGFPPMGGGMPEGFPPMGGMPEGFLPMGGMPEGFPPMGGMPGAPAADAPKPDMGGMNFIKNPSTNYPINLAVTMDRVCYTGRVTAALSKHAVAVAEPDTYDQLGVVTNTPAPVVNNGVILTLGAGTRWTVTGDCYLSALHISPDATVSGQNGRHVIMTVDGTELPAVPGDYTGDIRISLI